RMISMWLSWSWAWQLIPLQTHGGASVPPLYVHARNHDVGFPRWSPMIRSPIRPTAMPRASGAVRASATWKNRRPKRRMLIAFAIVAPVIPPRSEMPPSHTSSHWTGEENSLACAITYATRAPTIAPISDQNTIEFTASTEMPRRGASLPKSQAPIANPIAMKTPCGEEPRTLGVTGQPTDASKAGIAPSVAATSGTAVWPDPSDGATEQEPARDVARMVDADVDARGRDRQVEDGE